MSPASFHPALATVADLPKEDIVVLAAGTWWQVPWELMMLGPFVSCGLLDGEVIRHVTVPAMVASAARRRSTPGDVLVPGDYTPQQVFAAAVPLLDAAVSVVETGWDLAVVMDREHKVITARSLYRALVGSDAARAAPASLRPTCAGVSLRVSPTGGHLWPHSSE